MPTDLPLRALHAPPPLPWPGPTAFEWALLALVCLLTAFLGMRLRRQWLRWRWRRALDAELQLLAGLARAAPAEATRAALALMRRILLLHGPREEVAAVTGEQWLAALDACSGGDWFTQGSGRTLAVAGFAHPGDRATVQLALEAARRLVEASLARCPDPPDA